MYDLAVKAVATPLLIGAASVAGRRWGDHVGGWLVALPLTSGPVAFFLAADHGFDFASRAAVGMLAGTISQIGFALAYRALAEHGRMLAFTGGCVAFAAATIALSQLHWAALPTFALTAVALATAAAWLRRPAHHVHQPGLTDVVVPTVKPPRWDIPVRMAVATGVVLTITAAAPIIGDHLAGLLSPFPVFGAVVAVMAHHVYGPQAATATLEGLILGLAAPAVFFLTLALALPPFGLTAFMLAIVTALATQAATLLAAPSRPV